MAATWRSATRSPGARHYCCRPTSPVRGSVGILMVLRLALLGFRNRLELGRNPEIRVTGLYWHLVDVIWIFLYALIYLPGRSS